MEFRYRAVDGDRPPTATETARSQSTNPDFSFFSARPMLGCNRAPSEDHVREGIQREIEKEQIRQEIIAAETARRRELVAEVVHEMAMEKVMAVRRVAEMKMTLEEKLSMWINQRKLLNHNQNSDPLIYSGPPPMMQMPDAIESKETSIMESNKDKLIVLNRPDAIGAKRKAEDTQTGVERAKRKAEAPSAAGVGHLLSLDEKPKEEWSCDPCEVSFTTESDHQGKSHKTKESALKDKPQEMVSLKLPCLGKRYKFWCDICRIGTFSQTVMRNHELGKKHMAAVKQQNEPTETASTTAQKVDEMAEKETGKKVTFWCEVCNIRTYSEKVMETHRLGKRHKALLENQHNKPLAVLDTKLISLNADPGEKGDKA